MPAKSFCSSCGVPFSDAIDDELWSIYYRIDDSRSHRPGLSFTADWMAENVDEDDESVSVLNHAMGKDMASRGLCPDCGRPNLSGVDPSQVLSEEDAREMAEMAAEQASELRAGC